MHAVSTQDSQFLRAFEKHKVPLDEFDHRAHVRLAYIYVCKHGKDKAIKHMRAALKSTLDHYGVLDGKYHETITTSWVMAIAHFCRMDKGAESASQFIEQNPQLLDAKIMLSHYSAELLFSDHARAEFVAPDIEKIP